MVRIVALHQKPADPDAYMSYYLQTHMPIVRRVPRVRNIRYGKVISGEDGSPPPCWLISDVYFDDWESLQAALQSAQMQEAFADIPNFITPGNVTIMFCEAEDIAPLPGSQ